MRVRPDYKGKQRSSAWVQHQLCEGFSKAYHRQVSRKAELLQQIFLAQCRLLGEAVIT